MELKYRLVRSNRKSIAIQIGTDGEVIVRAPTRMPAAQIEAFVQSKCSWIEAHLPKVASPPKLTEDELKDLARRAMEVIPERVRHFAPLVGVSFGRITIRNQHTRWGSCSGKGNLNFNCLLMLAPEQVLDYVVVHELCHRIEMNHSPNFWAQVARVLPDYGEAKQWLREHGHTLIGRLP